MKESVNCATRNLLRSEDAVIAEPWLFNFALWINCKVMFVFLTFPESDIFNDISGYNLRMPKITPTFPIVALQRIQRAYGKRAST